MNYLYQNNDKPNEYMNSFSHFELKSNRLATSWLYLGVVALAVSGLLSLILVLARAPFLSNLLPKILPFKTALIVHVDLSVLVWMLTIAASIWSMFIRKTISDYCQYLCYLAWIGVTLISVSPFIAGEPISNNYVPIIQNLPFILGIACFLTAILITSLIGFVCYIGNYLAIKDHYHIISTSIFILIIASLCFVMSYMSLGDITAKYGIDTYFYYEILFWGGGHILQFFYTQITCFIWLMLCYTFFSPRPGFKILYKLFFFLNLLFALPALIIYWFVNIDDALYIDFFTKQMQYLSGISPILFIFTLGVEYISSQSRLRINTPYATSLISSVIIFLLGGLIGMRISGVNVTIPAHYHGSIVGISLAFMGYAYLYLSTSMPNCDLNMNKRTIKMSIVQPIIYACGQAMHISGLAIAGGYGALRKTPGLAMSLKAKVGMAIMGVGGIIAIIGGLMFVIICVNSLRLRKTESN